MQEACQNRDFIAIHYIIMNYINFLLYEKYEKLSTLYHYYTVCHIVKLKVS